MSHCRYWQAEIILLEFIMLDARLKPRNCLLLYFSFEPKKKYTQAGASKWWTNMCTNKPNYRINEKFFFFFAASHDRFSCEFCWCHIVTSESAESEEKKWEQIVIKHVVHKTEMHHHPYMWRIILAALIVLFRRKLFCCLRTFYKCTYSYFVSTLRLYKFINAEIVKNNVCVIVSGENIAQLSSIFPITQN